MQLAQYTVRHIPLVLVFAFGPLVSIAADWSDTGGNIPDAAWTGDTPILTADDNVGALAGEGGASGGSATYAIPINVVPGRAGMQPSVSLTYSSNAGNGIAGMGWSLSAGSAITRCGKTAAQDGVTDKVHFLKATDRLCLNGQRLVAVSGGYGDTGAEYRTEIDSFVKVVQSGDMDTTGTSFTVTYKSGATDTFGGTADSRHSLQGIVATLTWMISKSADVSGKNTITYEYTSHGNGEHTLARILYTGQDSTPGDRYVEFVYETRPDVSSGFRSGGLYANTQRLKDITTTYQSETVRQYRLTYELSETSGNSLLKTAEECGYEGATEYCLPATQFAWYENAPTYQLEPLQFIQQNGQPFVIPASGTVSSILPKKDMNGDGTLDWPTVFLNAEGEYKADNTYENLGSCSTNSQTYKTKCVNADFNKDGLTDSWKLAEGSPRIFQYAYANYSGSSPVLINTPISIETTGNLGDEILGIGDYNGDGYDDVMVRRAVQAASGGFIGTAKVEVFLHTKDFAAPYNSVAHFVYDIPARRINFMWSLDQSIEMLGDFDGNGIEDIYVLQSDFTEETTSTYAASFHKPRFRKVLLSQPNNSSYSSDAKAFGEHFTSGFGEAGPMPEYRVHEQLFDLNGDGLLDLVGTLFFGYQYRINLGNGELSDWLFMTGSNAVVSKSKKGFVRLFRTQQTGVPIPGSLGVYEEPRFVPSFVLDYDQDGVSDMLVPHDRVVSFCFDHPVMASGGTWVTQQFCDDEMYRVGESGSQPPLPDYNDRSLYKYYKVQFDVTGYNSSNIPIINATLEPTDIVSTVSQGASSDAYGNGHTGFVTVATCLTTYPSGSCTFGDASGNNSLSSYLDSHGVPMVVGTYYNRNTGSFGSGSTSLSDYEVVDKLKSATTALDVVTEWDFRPLNTGKEGADFYTVDQSHLETTPGYLHFSANINVVSQVRHSDGVGGMRAYNYKYRDATLSSQGRGFQGYEQIIVDDVANEIRSVSDYHIQFPLTGSLVEVRRCLIDSSDPDCSSLPISKTASTYDLWRDGILKQTVVDETTDYSAHVLENTAAENRYWVSPNTQTETQYQTDSSHSAANGAIQPITVSSLWTHRTVGEQTFDANSCQTFARNTYEEPSSANRSVSESTTTLYSADTSSWWLCKTNYQSMLTKAVSGRTGDYATIESGSDPQKEVKTTITWDSTHRKPSVTTVEVTQGGGKPTRTTAVYNTYGLPESVTIEGTNYDGTSYAMSDRDTTSTYTSDGYFLDTLTNDKGHVTTTVTMAKYGVPTLITDPNGQVTTMTYDHFGRLASAKAPGEPTVRTAYSWCSGVNGGIAWCPNLFAAKYQILTRATGAPDNDRYFDIFEREGVSLVRNFDDIDYYRVHRLYNSRGLLDWESNNHDNADVTTEKNTYYDGYDNLGRVTQKRSPQANDTEMQTRYAYSAQTVSITATSSGVGARILDMSRELNGLGQLVTTSDALSNVTEYAYDGSGNPIALSDPDGNVITTSFNALGQKIWVHDPNAGDSDFDYNSLGELEWQQDANGVEITTEYDDLGRIYERWTDGVLSGRWRYDRIYSDGRKGMLDYEQNTLSASDRHTKYYRFGTTATGKDYLQYNTHYIYENGVLLDENKHTIEYYYDDNFGRLSGIRYSTTDLRIHYEYNSLGYMTHIKNAASGYVYREATILDALGNITGSAIGNGVMTQVQTFHPATGQLSQNTVTKTSGGSTVHELAYDYDGSGNLYQSTVTASNGLQNFETFDYDDLHRLTESDRAYSSESRVNDTINYTFSALGNIDSKDDYFSAASYGNSARSAGGNAGPNAIRQITYIGGGTTDYLYDDNGNMLSGDGRTMTYNEFDKPLTIAKNGVTSTFSYGAALARYKQVKTGLSGGTQTSHYVDKMLEIERQGSRTTYRHYFDGVAVLHKEDIGAVSTWTMGFNLKGRLGSVVTLADENGDVLEHRSYDPFGKPRRGDFIDAGTIQLAIASDPHPEYALDPLTDRGFTDHEHLDEQEIIHMNGRVFDYNIGRFSSVDPYIQYPHLSQSLNPYSYILNNPLAGTDPSGYKSDEPKRETDVGTGSRIKGSRFRVTSRNRDRATTRGPAAVSNGGTSESVTPAVGQTDGTYASSVADAAAKFKLKIDDATAKGGLGAFVAGRIVQDFFITPVEEGARDIDEGNYSGAAGVLVGAIFKPAKAVDNVGDAVRKLDGPNVTKGLADPKTIRFSQDSIKGTFRDGRSVQDLAAGLKNGSIKPGDVPAIRTVQRNGQTVSIDNRRLSAFREAGVPIRTRPATAKEIGQAQRQGKFSAGASGTDNIRIRGQ